MAKVSGIEVNLLTNVSGINPSSITNISGLETANIPGWPGSGPSCTTEVFMYGRDIIEACNGRFAFYEFDSTNGVIYDSGQCGIQTAAPGYYQYYADNMVYFFDGTSLSLVGPCKGGK